MQIFRTYIPDFPILECPIEILCAFCEMNQQMKLHNVHPSSVVMGPVIMEPSASVGPFCFLRGPLYLGPNVKIGSYNEVARSIILDDTATSHYNCVLDSFLDKRVQIGGKTSIANCRVDGKDLEIETKNSTIRRAKFGAYVGQDCKLGGWLCIMPGTWLEANQTIIGPAVVSGRGKIRKLTEPSSCKDV